MKPLTVFIAAACVVLASSAVQASSVKYRFYGELKDGSAKISGWLEIDSPPSNSSSTPGLGAYWSDCTTPPPFLDWAVDIDGTTFEPGASCKTDELYVLDETTDPDQVLVYSTYQTESFAMLFMAKDGDAFSGVDIPDLARIDWDKIGFLLTDRSGAEPVEYEGKVEVFIVPLPMGVWLGFGMLGGLGLVRRLRRKN